MIKKILIANRGEIAVRIMRSCREMGITTVAVYSDADRKSMHVLYADEAYHIGPSPSIESYLCMDKILEVARKSNSDAIHPGYGFLSENAVFSAKCQEAGIKFIGPSPYAISQMGNKITARQTMIAAGVPVVPGTEADIKSEAEARQLIKKIGLPVMIKASAGGGGKGMRLVKEESEIMNAINSARSEAKSAFGDDTVYIEKYIQSPHHIEFQIIADQHGNVVHLFERECSVQRRHQKIIEETPSPILTNEVRTKMGDAAVAAAKAVNYEGAGTIEFIVDNNLNYYFLEMNTRLQVEHPITEMVVGMDLVKEQINIASGKALSCRQEDLSQKGHAIECRMYAEDASANFMPAPGKVTHFAVPSGMGIRVDGYVYSGFEIPMYYDPLIAKLVVWGSNRQDAIERTIRALREFKITGIKNSIQFLENIMTTPDFVNGNYTTHFIDENIQHLLKEDTINEDFENIAAITALLEYTSQIKKATPTAQSSSGSNWKNFGRTRSII